MNVILDSAAGATDTVLFAAIAAMSAFITALVWFIIYLLRDMLKEANMERATTLKEATATLASIASTVKTLGEILIRQEPSVTRKQFNEGGES